MRTRTISRMPARCVAALAAAGFLLAAVPAASAHVSSSTSTNACSTGAQLDAMLCLVNSVRTSHGISAVRRSNVLARSARLKATAIIRCRQFSHTPCGQSFGSVFRAVGYARGSYAVGENLAWGSGMYASAEHTVGGWLRSPAHRNVLLSRTWREVGVSAVGVTGLFAPGATTIWVAQFGRR